MGQKSDELGLAWRLVFRRKFRRESVNVGEWSSFGPHPMLLHQPLVSLVLVLSLGSYEQISYNLQLCMYVHHTAFDPEETIGI